MIVPLPKDGVDGKDGLSITNVQIDDNKHLICTLSDNSTIDAGELPGGTGGGLIQVNNKRFLPPVGAEDTLYLTKDDDVLYYWSEQDKLYRPVTGGAGANGIDFKTSSDIIFDGVETTFDLPIDNKKVSIYINGIYLTEEEDYTIDRTASPNTVTFIELWEDTDLCTVVWVNGTIEENEAPTDKVEISQLDTDITTIFNANTYILDTNINDPWPSILTIDGSKIINATSIEQKKLVKTPYIVDASNKIIGCGFVTNYNETADEFTIVLTKYGEGGTTDINGSLATKEDIDNLFDNLGDIDINNSTLATKEDIDKLFSNLGDGDISQGNIYAKKEDIDNLFSTIGTELPDTNNLAAKEDIDNLFK